MSYLDHFNLSGNPFAAKISPAAVFRSKTFSEALSRLDFFLETAEGIAAFAGPPGCGKTTLLRTFARNVSEKARVVCWNFSSSHSYGLLAAIIRYLGHKPPRCKTEAALRLADCLCDGQTLPIIAVDEAHLCPDDSLQDLRLLLEIDSPKPILLLLLGLPELSERFAQTHLRSLRQRITTSHILSPLSREESDNYIDHRLRGVGASLKLFDPNALNAIFDHSLGVPRAIHQVASRALLAASSSRAPLVDERAVNSAITDIDRF